MTILPDRADERVDACIARLAPGISRSAAQRLCEDGQVLLNGAVAKKNARVAPGASFYQTPGKGVDEIRIAYVLNCRDSARAIDLLAKGIARYNAR